MAKPPPPGVESQSVVAKAPPPSGVAGVAMPRAVPKPPLRFWNCPVLFRTPTVGKLVVLDVFLDEDQIPPPRGVEVLMPVPGKYVQMWEEKAFVGGGEGMVPPHHAESGCW